MRVIITEHVTWYINQQKSYRIRQWGARSHRTCNNIYLCIYLFIHIRIVVLLRVMPVSVIYRVSLQRRNATVSIRTVIN